MDAGDARAVRVERFPVCELNVADDQVMSMTMPLMTRRDALRAAACGFGYLALAGLAGRSVQASPANPLAARLPHFAPRAKRIIFLFMQGGVSHVDSFDYKP